MELVEVRDLDGPNLFTLTPAIKLEVRATSGDGNVDATLPEIAEMIAELHTQVGLEQPVVGTRKIDTPHHYALFFPWEWRSCALAIAEGAFEILVNGIDPQQVTQAVRAALERDRERDDRPEWVRDAERCIPAIGITGTNGKTTTTRLVAHILRSAGKHVGWSSSSGVYIDGEKVLEGDYTGPSGARRVLLDPAVEVGVLETARGGILLRGMAYESNDVGVFLNVSADHLHLQGVDTLSTLAEVKSIVVQVTRPEGLVVLNADDPLVLAQRERVRAKVLLFSQDPANAAIKEHVVSGGTALVRRDDRIVLLEGQRQQEIARLTDVPMTYGGAARHMVENALAGCGAVLGLGLPVERIAEGLRTFRSNVASNAGRLNVFQLDDRVIVIDYAHNESGLDALLRFSRALMSPGGRLSAIVGTAGDRDDDALLGLGRIAGQCADRIYVKENPRYLRGRAPGEALDVIRTGVTDVGALERLAGSFPSEYAAFLGALEGSSPGDAIAVMCHEDQIQILRDLRDRGATEWQA